MRSSRSGLLCAPRPMGLRTETLQSLTKYRQPSALEARWHAEGFYDNSVVGSVLTWPQRRWPWRPAIVDGDRRLTHGEVDAAASALAGGFRAAGVQPGDVVSWQTPNWWEAIVVALA